MAEITGSEIIARCLQKEGVKDLFFIMGGPMLLAEATCVKEGIRMIDVRHEQAAAFACQAYSRLKQVPSVCMAASGPGVTNLITGMANALIDCCPVVALGGSSPLSQFGRQVFQEIDQVELMRGCCKHVDRLINLKRIPQQINFALQRAISGKPGPVYLDCPGDMLYQKIDENLVDWSYAGRPIMDSRPLGDPRQIDALVSALAEAQKPLIVSGSGVIWSRAWEEMQAFVEAAGIPFYTTPQGRGVVPDDHPYSYLTMRSGAFRDADLIVVLGTRMNYIIGHASPPRFGPNAKIARIDIDPVEISTAARYVDIPVVGDCKAVLGQLLQAIKGRITPDKYAAWRKQLADGEAAKRSAPGANQLQEDGDIHPVRMLEAVRDFMKRDAILCVDGQETLNYGRQTMPTFAPGHRLNSGPFGTMGVGMPFGVGAKVACPDKQVIVVHGDGSMGLNAMELDTAIRHKIPLLVVISLNGGWTGDPKREKPGRDLGYTRYDKICEALGGYGEYVDKVEDIRPALERAQAEVDKGRVALVNVRTDYRARFAGVAFSDYST
ncbi:thiamine pyrophosphate-binding protein [Rhodopila sp.]|jgi:thiamine pyrophosphate-dependent acetolactate synthase large subunit-like protein|uniref:thiamine pyrophosphate-binding protein n=1 Tax=Rhodopila sp. TaxID=2480087 RepID=UPI002BF5079E|nr:thiamine pyrophosphate-binding protein [Rhodopila sp.]HVZ07106.1 thiamine pyrophosphate-binding protein [Rhodopila sp.]